MSDEGVAQIAEWVARLQPGRRLPANGNLGAARGHAAGPVQLLCPESDEALREAEIDGKDEYQQHLSESDGGA